MIRAVEPAPDSWTTVCNLEEIVPDTGVCALLRGQQVAVFRLGSADSVYAIANMDPFSGANVLSRGLVGDRAGKAKVASPIYKQSFCLETGVCLDDPEVRVAVFDARVRDGIVEIREAATRTLRSGNAAVLSEVQGA
jgi:nitrite reductase (NADH) small subunit